MKNINDNIITITGKADNIFDKAIFVLKSEQQEDLTSLDFVKEADKILNNYMLNAISELHGTKTTPTLSLNNKLHTKSKIKRNTKIDTIINRLLGFSIIFCGVVVMCLLMTM